MAEGCGIFPMKTETYEVYANQRRHSSRLMDSKSQISDPYSDDFNVNPLSEALEFAKRLCPSDSCRIRTSTPRISSGVGSSVNLWLNSLDDEGKNNCTEPNLLSVQRLACQDGQQADTASETVLQEPSLDKSRDCRSSWQEDKDDELKSNHTKLSAMKIGLNHASSFQKIDEGSWPRDGAQENERDRTMSTISFMDPSLTVELSPPLITPYKHKTSMTDDISFEHSEACTSSTFDDSQNSPSLDDLFCWHQTNEGFPQVTNDEGKINRPELSGPSVTQNNTLNMRYTDPVNQLSLSGSTRFSENYDNSITLYGPYINDYIRTGQKLTRPDFPTSSCGYSNPFTIHEAQEPQQRMYTSLPLYSLTQNCDYSQGYAGLYHNFGSITNTYFDQNGFGYCTKYCTDKSGEMYIPRRDYCTLDQVDTQHAAFAPVAGGLSYPSSCLSDVHPSVNPATLTWSIGHNITCDKTYHSSETERSSEQDYTTLSKMLACGNTKRETLKSEASQPSLLSSATMDDTTVSSSTVGEDTAVTGPQTSSGNCYFWQYNSQCKGPKALRLVDLELSQISNEEASSQLASSSGMKDPSVPGENDMKCISVESTDFSLTKSYSPSPISPQSLAGYPLVMFEDPVQRRYDLVHCSKLRRGDGNDVTPNFLRLRSMGEELDSLNQQLMEQGEIIVAGSTEQTTMAPVLLPHSGSLDGELNVCCLANLSTLDNKIVEQAKREKNKLASKICRLKKKAFHEANKIKYTGLGLEYGELATVIVRLKQLLREHLGPNLIFWNMYKAKYSVGSNPEPSCHTQCPSDPIQEMRTRGITKSNVEPREPHNTYASWQTTGPFNSTSSNTGGPLLQKAIKIYEDTHITHAAGRTDALVEEVLQMSRTSLINHPLLRGLSVDAVSALEFSDYNMLARQQQPVSSSEPDGINSFPGTCSVCPVKSDCVIYPPPIYPPPKFVVSFPAEMSTQTDVPY
ncbi:unnamed protein product [Calicophoron daubneyi]